MTTAHVEESASHHEAVAEAGHEPPARTGPRGFLKPGTWSHTAFWTHQSAGMLCAFMAFFQFGVTLHYIETWPGWLILAVAAAFVVVSAWYPNAQINSVQRALSREGAIDPKQVGRDFSWSIRPVFMVCFMTLMTIIAWILLGITDLFVEPGWNGINWAIRDRLILSPTMAFYCVVVLWMVKVDLGNVSTILTEMVQLAGRLMRFERAPH